MHWRFPEVPGKDNRPANEGMALGKGRRGGDDHAAFQEIKTRAGKECEVVGWTDESLSGFYKGFKLRQVESDSTEVTHSDQRKQNLHVYTGNGN